MNEWDVEGNLETAMRELEDAMLEHGKTQERLTKAKDEVRFLVAVLDFA